MHTTLTADIIQDDLAISLARAITTANKKAHELGVDVVDSLLSITQQPVNGTTVWRISYGPRDYINRRGGDVMIEVEADGSTIKRVLRGQ